MACGCFALDTGGSECFIDLSFCCLVSISCFSAVAKSSDQSQPGDWFLSSATYLIYERINTRLKMLETCGCSVLCRFGFDGRATAKPLLDSHALICFAHSSLALCWYSLFSETASLFDTVQLRGFYNLLPYSTKQLLTDSYSYNHVETRLGRRG